MKEIKRLKNILLFSILSVILLAAGTRLYIELKQHDAEAGKTVERELSTFELIFSDQIKYTEAFYTTQIQSILANKSLLDALANKDRQTLLNKLQPTFELLKKTNSHLTVFHIHDQDNRSLIRFHKPQVYGDKVYQKRKMLQRAHQTQSIQYGVEAGLHDGNHISYRIAVPVFRDGDYLGIIEFGIALDQLVSEISNTINLTTGDPEHLKVAFLIPNQATEFKDPEQFVQLGAYSVPIYQANMIPILEKAERSSLTRQPTHHQGKIFAVHQSNFLQSPTNDEQITSIALILNITSLWNKGTLSLRKAFLSHLSSSLFYSSWSFGFLIKF